MANYPSSKKSIRQNKRRQIANRLNIAKIRTLFKSSRALIASKECSYEQALAEFQKAQSYITKGVTKNVLKLNTASRKISSLNALLKRSHP